MAPPSKGKPTEAAKHTASEAKEKGKEVTQTATQETQTVAGDVRDQAKTVAADAKSEAKHVVEDAKSQLKSQAQDQTKKVAESLRRLADEADALAKGKPNEAGSLSDYVNQAASKLHEVAGRVESRGFDGLVQDTERFGRQRPGAFLFGAAAVGFLGGRLMRGAKDAQQQEQQQGQQQQQASQGTQQPTVPVAPVPPATAVPPVVLQEEVRR